MVNSNWDLNMSGFMVHDWRLVMHWLGMMWSNLMVCNRLLVMLGDCHSVMSSGRLVMGPGAMVRDRVSHVERLVRVMHWSGLLLVQMLLLMNWVLDMVHGCVSLLNVMRNVWHLDMVGLGCLVVCKRCLMVGRCSLMVHWLVVMYTCSLMVRNWGFMMHWGSSVMRHCMVQDWSIQMRILVVHWCFMVLLSGRVMHNWGFMMSSG